MVDNAAFAGGRLTTDMTIGTHKLNGIDYPKSVITDPVTGDAITYARDTPVSFNDDTTLAITIPSGTSIGTFQTIDVSGYQTINLQIDSGTGISVEFRQNETGLGSPPASPLLVQANPFASAWKTDGRINTTGNWIVPVTAKKMQIYVVASPTADIVLSLTKSRRPAPMPRGGRNSAFITSGATGFVFSSANRSLIGYDLMNTNAATRFLQIGSKGSAYVPGTDSPRHTIPIPAGQSRARDVPLGWFLGSGIAWAITTDAAGATVAASGDIVGSLEFT